MKTIFRLALNLAALAIATPAAAVTLNVPVTGADNTCASGLADTNPAAARCAGYFAGNALNQGSSATINAALTALAVSYSGHFSDYQTLSSLSGATDLTSVLGTLTGLQTFAIHYSNGGGAGSPGNVTAFYQADFGSGDTLRLNAPAAESLTLFTPRSPVPEPATWVMMLLGVGAIGASRRNNRRRQLQQLA